MRATHVVFEAYHYTPGATGIFHRKRSGRQDVTFTLHGDSITVALPPPAACVLYLTVTPQKFAEVLSEAVLGPRRP